MINSKYLLTFFCFLFSSFIFCQNETDENLTKITTVLDNYFDLEREAIHLNIDKTTFINNETIWYQGYVINRKTNKPYFTTNVFVLLFDENGKEISEKLVYASNGTFAGKIKLNSKLASGNYYIQVYTNWMNNFSENESTIIKITVINPTEGIKNYKKIDTESLHIFINPEGKSLISSVSNTIGIQVKDCNGNSPQNLEANIQNSSGEVIKTIKLNQFGFGKFDIVPSNDLIKVSVKYETKIIEKILPKPDLIGMSLEVNSFSLENSVAIKIKTNQTSYDDFQSKKLSLVIHQDQKLIVYPIIFDSNNLDQTFLVKNSDLQIGINTIRIIDSNLKQWAERIIYVGSSAKSEFSITKNKRNEDKISLIGYSKSPNAIMSVSVLPEDTKSIGENNSIIAGITINPYLNNYLENASYYLNSQNRLKLYELDLLLLNQEKLKYNWDYMKLNPPKSNYSFDVGINLKGKIDPLIKNKTFHKVKLVVNKDLIMSTSDVSELGEYQFENLLLTDSTLVDLSLQKLPNFEGIPQKLIPQIINRKRSFNKKFTGISPEICNNIFEYEPLLDLDLPKFEGKIINLKEVIVKNKKMSDLTYGNILSNTMLKGYKIDEKYTTNSLLNFIEYNGFVVTRNQGKINISSRQRMSLNLPDPTPLVYINDRQLFSSFDELGFMQMIEIDEIFIDSRAIVASMNNNAGIIKIYTKKPKKGYFSKPNPNSFFIKDAFSDNVSFKNEEYANTQSIGFDNFAILGWFPRISSNESGDFGFDVIDYNKTKSKIIIDGMDSEGNLFHEEKLVELK
jgi:hypothetical protein